jgi:phage tail-like protein
MGLGDRNDAYQSFNFYLSIQGFEVAAFSEASGLTADGEGIAYRVGTDPNIVRQLPGLRKVNPIVLKRGYTKSNELWEWYLDIFNGIVQRRTVGIVLQDEAHRDVLRWNINEAWINKIEGPSFNAMNNEVAIETCELLHEGITLEVQ